MSCTISKSGGEVARAGRGGERGDELGRAVLREERVGVAQRRGRQTPQLFATAQTGDQVVDHVGRERAGDPCFEVALGAVVEQRSSRLDLRRRVGEVVGERLVAVGATVGGQVADGLADHALRRGR